MKFIQLTLIAILVLVSTVKSGEYYKVDGRMYYLSHPLKKNWYQAVRFCNRNGMNLLDIRTETENVRVLSLIERFRTTQNTSALIIWTSGTDLGSEGRYYWMTTGEEFLYTHWSAGSPDNYRHPTTNQTENCMVIQGAWKNMWNDAICESEYPFICRDAYDVPIYKTKSCTSTLDEF